MLDGFFFFTQGTLVYCKVPSTDYYAYIIILVGILNYYGKFFIA